MEVKAILFDVRSIQKYIYASNRLKTNIGASYIVEHVFDTVLADSIKKVFGEKVDVSSWSNKKSADFATMDAVCQIAYIGGGNALVFIKKEGTEEGIQQKLVTEFTKKLLITYPGLHAGAAIGEIELGKDTFQAGLSLLYKKLKDNQNNLAPVTNIPYTGLTLLCDDDGETANYYGSLNGNHRFYSQEALSKENASEAANKALYSMFSDIFAQYEQEYVFPMEIDKLGQKEQENYIAVVHIDGNNMGIKFQGCHDFAQRRILSQDIRSKTQGSFGKLLKTILDDCENNRYKDALAVNKDDKKRFIPIRPLIIGGDDVTFVCPAKVALAYSKRFMEFMLEEENNIESPEARSIDSCGGIAILPTSYPFFRGYVLAEQLCDSAKKQMRKLRGKLQEENKKARENNSNIKEITENELKSCWLDFILLHGEQAPTLEQILQQEYKGVQGNMHFGPYRVANSSAKHAQDRRHNIENLLDCAAAFNKFGDNNSTEKDMANNKVKALRAVLQQGEEAVNSFMQQLNHTGTKMPKIDGWSIYEENDRLWKDGYTPYIDAIEIMDFMEGVN